MCEYLLVRFSSSITAVSSTEDNNCFFCTFEMENVVDLGLHQTRGLNINAIYSKTNDEQTLRMLTHTTQNMRQL